MKFARILTIRRHVHFLLIAKKTGRKVFRPECFARWQANDLQRLKLHYFYNVFRSYVCVLPESIVVLGNVFADCFRSVGRQLV